MKLTPIEEIMYSEMLKSKIENIAHIYPQQWIGRYRVDFLLKPKNKDIKGLIVECDGSYHKDSEVYKKDLKRERELEKQNYKVIRFQGKLIYDHYVHCNRDDSTPIDVIRFYLKVI